MLGWFPFSIHAEVIVLKSLASSYSAPGIFFTEGGHPASSPSLQQPALPKAQDGPVGQVGTIRDFSKATVVPQTVPDAPGIGGTMWNPWHLWHLYDICMTFASRIHV